MRVRFRMAGMVVLVLASALWAATPATAQDSGPQISGLNCSPNPATTDYTVSCQADVSTFDGEIQSFTWDFGDGTVIAVSTSGHRWVAPGTYTVTLSVTDSAGQTSSASVQETIQPAAPPGGAPVSPPRAPSGATPPPQTPSNMRATPLDAQRIRFDWSDSASSEDGIRLSDASSVVAVLPAHTTSYTVTGLQPGTQYCAIVQAFGPGGVSDWSNWACATTYSGASTAPPPPGGRTGSAPGAPISLVATALDSSAIRLTWLPGSGEVDHYDVADGAFLTILASTDGPATSFTLTGLDAGAQYCSVVYAVNQYGNSDPSNQACATTLP